MKLLLNITFQKQLRKCTENGHWLANPIRKKYYNIITAKIIRQKNGLQKWKEESIHLVKLKYILDKLYDYVMILWHNHKGLNIICEFQR